MCRDAIRRLRRAVVVLVALTVVASCSRHSPSTLRPGGPGARRIEGFWWLLFWISAAVCAIVIAGVALVVARRSRTSPVDRRDPSRFVLLAGAAVPMVVLTVVFAISLADNEFVAKPMGGGSSDTSMTVEVTGHQWWWEVRYPPPAAAVTANEIHIPVDTDVRLTLTTDDVLHSFWVPQLMPKTDLIAGKTNTMWIRADEPGRYRGQCAEYCGMQHGHMAFLVVAEPRADFDRWLAWASRDASPPQDAALQHGLDVFNQVGCASCHTIRGTTARGEVGPDLTTVGDRWSLGAGTVANDARHLGQWVSDPQQFKPGIAMPPQAVSGTDLPDLVAYLRSLRLEPQAAP